MKYYYAKFAREQEFAADKLALELLINAGYNPDKALELYRKLAKGVLGKIPGLDDPSPFERLKRLEKLLKYYRKDTKIVSSLEIVPKKDRYQIGDTLTAEFTITNTGTVPITFDVLTVGGRINGKCPKDKCPDFEWKTDVTLKPNASYNYKGKLKLETPGNYHFFTAYRTKDGWNTAIPTEAGINNTIDIQVVQVEAQLDNKYRELQRWLFGDAQNVRLTAEWDAYGEVWCGLLVGCRHTGIDFAASESTPVYSATDGVVIRVEDGGDCGKLECLSTVAIYNKATDVTFLYLHYERY